MGNNTVLLSSIKSAKEENIILTLLIFLYRISPYQLLACGMTYYAICKIWKKVQRNKWKRKACTCLCRAFFWLQLEGWDALPVPSLLLAQLNSIYRNARGKWMLVECEVGPATILGTSVMVNESDHLFETKRCPQWNINLQSVSFQPFWISPHLACFCDCVFDREKMQKEGRKIKKGKKERKTKHTHTHTHTHTYTHNWWDSKLSFSTNC